MPEGEKSPGEGSSRLRSWFVVAGILAMAAVPPAAYRLALGPSLATREAMALAAAPGTNAVLVDVRPPEAYARRHVPGSVSWPMEEIEAAGSAAAFPEALRGRVRLLMLCDMGVTSGRAARRLRALGADAWNVEGGLEAWWGAHAPPGCTARDGALPYRASPPFEQWLSVLSGFAIKPVYMLLSLMLAAWLWRRRDADLSALKWAMVAFFIGELACYLNYIIARDTSRLMEYFHSYGMIVSLGFGSYALFQALDHRVFGFSDAAENCALVGLCRPCGKRAEAPCGLIRLFLWLTFFAFLLCFIPLTAEPRPVAYDTTIFGTPYTHEHPLVYQLNEIRLCPLAALALTAAAWAALRFRRGRSLVWPKILLAGGLGFLGFSLMRLALLSFYRENLVWFAFWEEATELMGILGAGLVLWLFRKGLWARA